MKKETHKDSLFKQLSGSDRTRKACSFHVPGHGPDFEKMTNVEIKRHIKFIEESFEMAFGEDDEGEDEDEDV